MKRLDARLHDLVVAHGRELHGHLPGIRHGDPDAIHDARVATRRIRAVMAVLADDHRPSHDGAVQEMRLLGDALGQVRDLDVAVKLFEEKVWQVPAAARTTVSLGQAAIEERVRLRRELIKVVERRSLGDFLPSILRHGRSWWPWTSDSAEGKLQRRTHEQSVKLSAAIEHASGVYFPNRLHSVRIHVKRLRYFIELAAQAGRLRDDRELTVLKRLQSLLGNLHDRELLIRRLERSGEEAGDVAALRRQLVSERDDLFQDYLARRDGLREVSERIQSRTVERGRNWTPVAAMLAVPSAVVIGLVSTGRGGMHKQRPSVSRIGDRSATRA